MKAYRLFDRFDHGVLRSVFATALLCVCVLPELVLACSCARPPLEARYERSENVFTALITGGRATSEGVDRSPRLKTYFEVTETFKGSIPFNHFSSHADSNSCGISLQVGVEYLVFAPDTGKIGLCSGIIAVSGDSGQAVTEGSGFVDALRAFKTGAHKILAEPWQFVEQAGICKLSGRFSYRDGGYPASVHVTYWTRLPDNVVPNPDEPDRKAGFTQMTVWVPGRDDLTDYPLSLKVGDQDYIAWWQEVEYRGARYFVDSDDVPDLIAALVNAEEIRMKSAHPRYGDVDTAASLLNAGDSVSRMHQCMSSQLGDPNF